MNGKFKVFLNNFLLSIVMLSRRVELNNMSNVKEFKCKIKEQF